MGREQEKIKRYADRYYARSEGRRKAKLRKEIHDDENKIIAFLLVGGILLFMFGLPNKNFYLIVGGLFVGLLGILMLRYVLKRDRER